MRTAASSVLLLVAGALSAQVEHIPLDSGWRFGRMGEETLYPAVVPGVVHTDLLRAGLIPDPYQGGQADSVQWIERAEWTYERTIDADSALLAHGQVDLVFKGIDTFADVYLNGTRLGSTDNMFRTWEFPVAGLLRPGTNLLRVHLRSPITEGAKRRDAYGIRLPHDNDPTGVSPFVRKAAYQFGWDFCPRLVTSGIWRPVELRCWNEARIAGVRIAQRHGPEGVELAVQVEKQERGGLPSRTIVHLDSLVATADGDAPVLVPVRHPRLWWPNGAGEQPLYRLRVELWRGERLCDMWSGDIGLRTVQLDQQDDGNGRAFTFRVNGRPIFMKGCNLVPPGMFLPAEGDSAWVRLVDHMRRANMDMVRVWAGGVYPPEAFFAACDTAGILVWQDFMLANLPPDDPAFLANLEAEAEEQAARIGLHPSLALWCGNNELDVAWKNWGWQRTYHLDAEDSATVAQAYARVFLKQLPPAGIDVPYVHTSPLSNWGNAEGLRHGDLHYWGVWHGDSALSSLARNVGRFVSEYGFQSYPDSALLARYLPPEQLRLGSPLLRKLQRSYRTDRPILEALRTELGEEPATLGAFIAGSQDMQARACRIAIEAHAAARPRCMGTLVWQLNDPWPGPSWSLVDRSGRWKPAMYVVRDLYGHIR